MSTGGKLFEQSGKVVSNTFRGKKRHIDLTIRFVERTWITKTDWPGDLNQLPRYNSIGRKRPEKRLQRCLFSFTSKKKKVMRPAISGKVLGRVRRIREP